MGKLGAVVRAELTRDERRRLRELVDARVRALNERPPAPARPSVPCSRPSVSNYKNNGCRCPGCTAAASADRQAWRARRKAA